ncbi:Phosphoenolpyruvate carboxykinase, ATP-utilising [Paracoccaceae bacterium]
MLRLPERAELDSFTPEWTIINCTTFKADPTRHGCRTETVIALNFDKKLILIGNTAYVGGNKKSVFTLLNYLLPEKGVMPMHCSANHAPSNVDETAVFFGLSSTGKTTLSTAPDRRLIGDDEHGWSDRGTFNFEGGCYAKTINLSAEAEIYATTHEFATVLENMVNDPETLEPDFADASLTENTRCAYPLDYISNASATGLGGMPKNVIMITCDAYGVLPPIARLTPAQAMYYFLSGFTSKTPGTERGVVEPTPPSQPALARLSCRAGRKFTASCCRRRLQRPGPLAGWSTPAGRGGGVWRRTAHADQGHPRTLVGGFGWLAEQGEVPRGSELWL